MMFIEEDEKESRRERYERKRGRSDNTTDQPHPKRKDPYKRQQVNYDDWDEEWFEDGQGV